jgi:hypothetical protein
MVSSMPLDRFAATGGIHTSHSGSASDSAHAALTQRVNRNRLFNYL